MQELHYQNLKEGDWSVLVQWIILYLVRFSNKMFFMWDGNHHIQAWMPYISELHNDDPS
jgi:hypothetical protein